MLYTLIPKDILSLTKLHLLMIPKFLQEIPQVEATQAQIFEPIRDIYHSNPNTLVEMGPHFLNAGNIFLLLEIQFYGYRLAVF